MKILVAEDEHSIALVYQTALQSRGHEVTITNNGIECWKEYQSVNSSKCPELPVDAVILDYRMPEMNGLETAEKILKVQPKQRIIFASAYMKQTWLESINRFGIVAELLQKPFEINVLVDAVEDTSIYSQLQNLKVNIGDIRSWNPSHEQLADLLDAMTRIKDPKTVFAKLLSSFGFVNQEGISKTLDHDNVLEYGKSNSRQRNHQEIKEQLQEINSKSSNVLSALLEEALQFLGPEWVSIFYYQLSKVGIHKEDIVQNPLAFLQALDRLFGTASILVKAKIFEVIKVNKEAIGNLETIEYFAKLLGEEIKTVPKSRGK